ncbi:hypothetical protein HNR46_002160 [Haloferula luteola]|uniref:Uncharacterized protein n=1 Tax=Haloferula luteola TaxID=595692 RepID=A0A840VGK9_9BACT|nr:hypothetical protein [Haloferula luteola]MBB5351921.1 hypothetical protein [Haloferula luteola]
MKVLLAIALLVLAPFARANIDIDIAAYGESLGGWKDNTVSYALSGAQYRTYKPEITPTPDGGIFVSVRIDHRRGWLASDDHAVLEITFQKDGSVANARSTLAVQGRTISSDLIRSTATAGAEVGGVAGAVKVGTDLVADLSSKLLREKIVEAGRVAFPSAVQHNYNLLYQAVRLRKDEVPAEGGAGATDEAEPATTKPAPPGKTQPLEIQPYGKEDKK